MDPGDEASSYAGSPDSSPLRRGKSRSKSSPSRSKSSPSRKKRPQDRELGSHLLQGGGADPYDLFDEVFDGAGDVFESPYASVRATPTSPATANTPPDRILDPGAPSIQSASQDLGGVSLGATCIDPSSNTSTPRRSKADSMVEERGALVEQSGTSTPSPCDAAKTTGHRRLWVWWIWGMVASQVKVLVPVSLFLILFQIFALRQPVTNLGAVIGGLASAMLGLSLFMLGLEIGIMPLGEAMGRALPRKTRMSTMLFLVFVLGCGCTFAEPAVSALQIAGQLIDPIDSPYLWLLLVDPGYNTALIIAIALGVGAAALVGTLRTIRAWSLKLVILLSTLVVISLTIALQHSPAAELTGMAWDSGAVTTGCVTVPLVLALGVGILSSTRRDGSEAGGRDPSPLDGFGIVTLASIFPVIFVLILGLAVGHTVTVDDILEREPVSNRTRLALGLNVSMALILDPELAEQSAWAETPWLELWVPCPSFFWRHNRPLTYLTIRAISPLVFFLIVVFKWIVREPFPRVSIGPVECSYTNQPPWYGVAVSFVGLLLFNIGLSYGLSALGSMVGAALPGLFMHIDGNESSPLMDREGGLAVAALFCWFLGLCATLAEPALNQLGITTEALTRGKFRKVLVIGSVAAGVSVGVMLGTLKLILDLREALFYMLYGGYGLALALTALSTNEFVCVAWDSAGVTTGAVTVPLVLAIGLGIGLAVEARDAFGLLAMASVMPILSVLATGLVLNRCTRRAAPPSPTPGTRYAHVNISPSHSMSTISLSSDRPASSEA